MQFVGSWDYETMEFKIAKSFREVLREQIGTTSIVAIENIKQLNENIMFNLTATFKDIEIYPLSMPISIKVD